MNTRAELERIARQWISLWCAPVDWDLFDRLHRDDFVDESSAGRASTKAGFAEGLVELLRAFPDLETTVEDLVIDEAASRVAVRWAAWGTNCAPLLGVGPTNRATPFSGIEIVEVRDGRIARRWGEWDISAHVDGG